LFALKPSRAALPWNVLQPVALCADPNFGAPIAATASDSTRPVLMSRRINRSSFRLLNLPQRKVSVSVLPTK
jgi:hypothetical protein